MASNSLGKQFALECACIGAIVCGGDASPGEAHAWPQAHLASTAHSVRGASTNYTARFLALLESEKELEYEGLVSALAAKQASAPKLSFEPTSVRYFREVNRALALNDTELRAYRTNGFVVVDHASEISMGQAYLEIYQADLPVFVSVDSILHALHRSYDQVVQDLEEHALISNFETVLATVERQLSQVENYPALRDNLDDLALYTAVARNLLAGVETGKTAQPPKVLRGDARVARRMLDNIDKLTPDDPNGPGTAIYGERRVIDWSQFRPRGHYVKTPALTAYFRTMMWLGRADLGWRCTIEDDRNVQANAVADRQLRNAALLTLLVQQSGQSQRLLAATRVMDFLVGRSDGLDLDSMQSALRRARVTQVAELRFSDALARIRAALLEDAGSHSQIRSAWLAASENGLTETPIPLAFQLFGQRFVLDSFLLSKVVYDSISFHGRKPERVIPTGLDVAAALGSNEAVFQLKTEIEQHHYASNLLAARQLVSRMSSDEWQQNLYMRWLNALRQLHESATSSNLPQSMRSYAWQRKELQTTLASWAELRHDTILYAAQSETAGIMCEYPEGYVEPYPKVYAALGALARDASRYLGNPNLEPPKADPAERSEQLHVRQGKFFEHFAVTMDRLEIMAKKELAAQPFDNEEKTFLKQVMEVSYGCGGPPSYYGWYPSLFYGGEPVKREPTVADVHTDPNSGTMLEAAVGDARYLVIAVDSQQHRAAYVGPVYSYYEFHSRLRLTDKEWVQRIASTKPPAFTEGFVTPAVKRSMRYSDAKMAF